MYRAVLITILCLLTVTDSYRILAIFPTPCYSHQITFRPVMEKLAERGHEVVVLTPYPSGHPNLTEIDLSVLKSTWERINFVQSGDYNYVNFIMTFVDVQITLVDQILEHPEVQQLLQREGEHFDGVICEFLGYTPTYAFARFFGAPLIGMTSLDMFPEQHVAAGNPAHMTLHPNSAFPFYGRLGFWERVGAVLLQEFLYNAFVGFYFRGLDRVTLKHFGPIGTSAELTKDITFAITNAHPALDNVRPLLPSTIQVGFLHIRPPQPLPTEFDAILGRPTIYLSFGTNVRSGNVKSHTMNVILEAIRQLPEYNFIWKWDDTNGVVKSSNLFFFDWIPQQDLLAHKNVKLFITQAGLQSMEEAIDRGVPMLAIPFWGDQITNAPKIQNLGIGLHLEKNGLTGAVLRQTILELVNNSSYKEKILELGKLVKDTPMPPVETAAWWIEYAIRHKGAPHYRYPAARTSVWEYYLLDVILFTLVLLLVIAAAVTIAFFKLKRFVLRRFTKIKKN